MYQYSAKILRVIDADTLELQIDLGFRTHHVETLRLYGINAPEMNTPEGKAAKAEAVRWFQQAGDLVVIETIKDRRDKYGRILAVVMPAIGKQSLNDHLNQSGHAKPYMV